MAVGSYIDVKDVDFDTADTLDMAASAGEEWLYQGIDHTDNIDLYAYDGSNEKLVRSYTGSAIEQVLLRVTETERYRIHAGTGAANNAYVRAWGVRTA